jgi:hypothetical protein
MRVLDGGLALVMGSGRRRDIGRATAVAPAEMGRTSRVQLGQIAGAGELLFAHNIPATKVSRMQAVLLA